MSYVPAPDSPTNPPASRRPAWPGILLATVVIGAAVWFLGDVPNRYHAAQEMRAGRVALLASDLPTALGHFRAAALRRPTDEAVIRQYDETQSRWVEKVSQQLMKLEAGEAYVARLKLPAVEANLVEPHLGTYREFIAGIDGAARNLAEHLLADAQEQWEGGQFTLAEGLFQEVQPYAALVPELAAKEKEFRAARLAHGLALAQEALEAKNYEAARKALQEVATLGADTVEYRDLARTIDETEVRAALQVVADALAKDDFDLAGEQLARVVGRNLLPDEVAAAQTAFRVRARQMISNEIAHAIAQEDAAAAKKALERGQRYAGWEPLPVERLLQPADLPAFLTALKAFDLDAEKQGTYANRLDLPLVLIARKKFPEGEVKAFARDTFLAWSRSVQKQGLLGYALFLDDRAQEFGAPADAAWREGILAGLQEKLNVTVAVADPVADANAPAGLNGPATAALRKALKEKLGAWPKLIAPDPKHRATVILTGKFAGMETNDEPQVTQRSIRYQSGTEEYANEERNRLINEHNDLVAERDAMVDQMNANQDKIERGREAALGSWEKSEAIGAAAALAFQESRYNEITRQVRDLRAQANRMPETLREPAYATDTYEEIQHSYECILGWRLEADMHGRTGTVGVWAASTIIETEEVRGDASHGVPVKKPEAITLAKVAPAVVPQLIAEVANVDALLKKLPAMTVEAFAAFYEKEPFVQMDQLLALDYAWARAGHTLEDHAKLVEHARGMLSLPE